MSAAPSDAPAAPAGPAAYTACVIGGTGATGRHVVRRLLYTRACTRVTALVRRRVSDDEVAAKWLPRPAEVRDGEVVAEAEAKAGEEARVSEDEARAKLVQVEVDFEALAQAPAAAFAGHDVALCTLGTTRAQAGSAAKFFRVDHDYVLGCAQRLREAGTRHFSYMSSQGSNADSSLLYPRTKGLVERELIALGFPRVSIFRPGLLLTPRDSETRVGEAIAQAIYPNFLMPQAWKATKVEVVAESMVLNAERAPLHADGAAEVYETAALRLLQVGSA